MSFRLLGLLVSLLAFGPATEIYAQPAPQPCNPEALIPTRYTQLMHSNFAWLRLHETTFPDELVNPANPSDILRDIRSAIHNALVEGALDWNQACEPIPMFNDQPVLIAAGANFQPPPGQNAIVVDVFYVRGSADEEFTCGYPEGERCTKAVTQTAVFEDRAEIYIYEKSGRILYPDYTLIDYRGVYHRLFDHELGHLLLLNHDTCPQSPVNENILKSWRCAFGDPNCEPLIRQEHCDTMKATFEPSDPLEQVLTENPESLCRLNFYCDRFDGAWIPWSKIRSGCVWFRDVQQTHVNSYDGEGNHIGGAVRTYTNFKCYGGGFNVGLSTTVADSPFLLVADPQDGAVVQNWKLKVRGWVWGRTNPLRELRFFLDLQDVVLSPFTFPIDSSALCATGIDPGYCDSQSGFSGYLDLHGVSPGLHKLLIVATDLADDPLPAHLEIEFTVPEAFVNHPPSAQDDEITITMVEGIGPERVIEVLANDFDVDGQAIKLIADAIVEHPNQGSVYRLDDRRVIYRPFPWASGTDSFRYRIVDEMGLTAVAEVQIRLMEAIILE